MLDTNNATRQKEKVNLVITRQCRAQTNDETKIKKYLVGDEDVFIRKYADVLVSMNKAVVKDSIAHKAWVDYQKRIGKTDAKKTEK